MVQSPVLRVGEECPLAGHQLRLGKSVHGAPAPTGGSLADVCVTGGAGGLTAGRPPIKMLPDQRGPRQIALIDHPMNRFLSANVN